MDLWIRTQDRMNLVKVNQVSINYQNNNQIIANYIPDFIGTQGEYYENLGTYKTKERALEVLDEINIFKDFFQFVELLPNNKKWEYLSRIDFKNGDTLTYEMPKE